MTDQEKSLVRQFTNAQKHQSQAQDLPGDGWPTPIGQVSGLNGGFYDTVHYLRRPLYHIATRPAPTKSLELPLF